MDGGQGSRATCPLCRCAARGRGGAAERLKALSEQAKPGRALVTLLGGPNGQPCCCQGAAFTEESKYPEGFQAWGQMRGPERWGEGGDATLGLQVTGCMLASDGTLGGSSFQSLHLGCPLTSGPTLWFHRGQQPSPCSPQAPAPGCAGPSAAGQRLGQGGCRGLGPCGRRTQGRPAGRSQALGEGPGLGLSPHQVRGRSPEPGRPGGSLQGPRPGVSHTRSEGASGSARPPSAVCSLPAGCWGLATSPLAGARQQRGSGSPGPLHSGECPMGFCSGPRAQVLGNPLGSASPAQMPSRAAQAQHCRISCQLEGDRKRSQPVLPSITDQERSTQVV